MRLGLPDAVLNRVPPFSFGGEKDGQGIEGELLAKEFENRRGMASDVCWKKRREERIGLCRYKL